MHCRKTWFSIEDKGQLGLNDAKNDLNNLISQVLDAFCLALIVTAYLISSYNEEMSRGSLLVEYFAILHLIELQWDGALM